MRARSHDRLVGVQRDLLGDGSPLAQGVPGHPVREYLSADQLAEVTPWSVDAIAKMVKRGVLKRGVHCFQPFGRRTQLVFKWSAIVALIEGHSTDCSTSAARVLGPFGVGVEKATANLRGLLGR